MKRRYLCLGVGAFALGIVIFDWNMLAFCLVWAIMLFWGVALLFKRKTAILVYAFLLLTGGLYGNYFNTKNSPLDKYADNPCSGEMYVTDIDHFDKERAYITVRAVVTKVNDEKINEPVLLSIYGISDIKVNTVIHFGELKFKIPETARNDGGFDYNRFLKSKGIYYTASADVNDLKASGTDGFFIMKFFRTLKQQFAKRCERVFGESYAKGIIPAILTGNDIYVSKEVKDVFADAGITHILVASGLHVSIVVLIASFLLFPFRKKRWIYDLLLGVFIVCFALLVGYTPSIIRAVASFFIYFIARKLLRSADPITILFEAMAIILIVNPLSIYNLSFQLSFSAVFGILVFTSHIAERLSWFVPLPRFLGLLSEKLFKGILRGSNMATSAAAVSVSAQLGVLPFMVNSFGGMAIFTIFVNIIISFIIPVLYGVGIVAVICNLEPFVTLTKWICTLIFKMAEITVSIPGNNMQLPKNFVVTLAVTLFVAACLLRCKVPKFKPFFEPCVYSCTAVIVASCLIVSYIPSNMAKVTFLNVGHGDCAVIRLSNNKTIVVDTGTENMCDFEVIPYLERQNIGKIDYLFLSHGDDDHAGGAKILAENIKVDTVVTGQAYQYQVENANHRIVKKGDKIKVENACFEILYAPDAAKNDNDSSVVMRMDFGKSSFLFTGDITKNAEPLVDNVDTDVLKVSHHGAKNASTGEFLKRVSPMYSVISLQKNNTYNHPDEETLERLQKVSKKVLRTDRDKTITIFCDKNGNFRVR